MRRKEEAYYHPVKQRLKELFEEKVDEVHLERTAEGNYTRKLKRQIPERKEIIFSFLQKGKPDLAGFIPKKHNPDFIVVEIKKEADLDAIYQTRKYINLFHATFGFLIYIKPLSIKLERLLKREFEILDLPTILRSFSLAQYDEKKNEFVDWHKENPFHRASLW